MTDENKIMNCDQYMEAIAANPSSEDGVGHASECAMCRVFRDEMLELDAQIKRALLISVPQPKIPNLDSVDDGNIAVLPRRRVSTPAWFAMAASILIAAVLGFRMIGSDFSDPSLADQIVAHLEHEPYAFRITDKAVGDERLARVVPADIATLDHSGGLITYAQSCVINGKNVPHLVIQGERGPVTILLMPGQKVSGAQSLDGNSITGVILPVGSGSIAIIGEKGEDLQRFEKKIKNSVTWTT